MDSDGTYKVPVMIHRAICGSLERMIAILLETYGKKLPFWLNPKQIALVPINGDSKYLQYVKNKLQDFEVTILDDPGCSFNKRIRNASTSGFSIICVIGKEEEANETVNLRIGETKHLVTLNKFMETLNKMIENKKEYDEMPDISSLSIN